MYPLLSPLVPLPPSLRARSYFKNLGKQYKTAATRERAQKAVLRSHPRSALMQVCLYLCALS